jgi:hypothetical protein
VRHRTAADLRLAGGITLVALGSTAAAVRWLWWNSAHPAGIATMIAVDDFRFVTDWLFLGTAAVTVLVSFAYLERENLLAPEYYVLLLFATLGMMLMGIGIGFAFSAMANLIVEAVPSEQTGVATGMHTITRTIGNAFGSQAAATIVAGSIAATGLPQESGFTTAFAVFAVALLFAFVAVLFVPPRRIQVLASTPALAQAE